MGKRVTVPKGALLPRLNSIALLVLFTLCCPFACSPRQDHSASVPVHALSSTLTTDGPPQALKVSRFLLHLSENGHPVVGQTVTLSLNMSTMFMPPNIVQMKESGPGAYTGQGTFTMSGEWTALATATGPGSKKSFGPFPLNVKD